MSDAPISPKGSHGGPRPNSGRKPGGVAELRRALETRFSVRYAADADAIYDTLKAMALGTYKALDDQGRVYTVKPSLAAIRELNDRGMGKPRQPIELSSQDTVTVPPSVEATLDRVWGDEPGDARDGSGPSSSEVAG